jgi:WD40 repeat protein
MSDAIEVELSGEDDRSPHSPGFGGGRGVWLLVGIGLGFAFSFLFNTAIPEAEPDPPGGATATTLTPASGVGAVIPEFPDGMNILVSPGEGRALEVLTWPLQGQPFYRSIPLGDIDLDGTAQFDASGQFLAATTATPDGLVLRGGRPNTFGVVASGVTGFAWHDSNPADLAWSTLADGELQIWVSEDAGLGEVVVSGVGLGDHVVAFGDWGFAVATPGGDDLVLDPNGELIGFSAGRIVASHASGLLLVTDAEGASVVAVTNIETLFNLRIVAVNSVVIGAEFSPDGDRVALTGPTGLTVAELGEEIDTELFEIRAGSDSLSWSSDGRFVLASAFRGVAVLDTETGEISSILESETTRSVAATPISGP